MRGGELRRAAACGGVPRLSRGVWWCAAADPSPVWWCAAAHRRSHADASAHRRSRTPPLTPAHRQDTRKADPGRLHRAGSAAEAAAPRSRRRRARAGRGGGRGGRRARGEHAAAVGVGHGWGVQGVGVHPLRRTPHRLSRPSPDRTGPDRLGPRLALLPAARAGPEPGPAEAIPRGSGRRCGWAASAGRGESDRDSESP